MAGSLAGSRDNFGAMYVGEYLKTRADEPLLIMATSGEVVTYRQFEDRGQPPGPPLPRAGLEAPRPRRVLLREQPAHARVRGRRPSARGLYYTCINSYLTPDEVAYIVNDCESRIVVTSAAKREVAMQLPALCPNVERWLMVDVDAPDGAVRAALTTAWPRIPPTPIADEQLGAAMLYSSGTTGRPKGILRPLPDVHPATPLPVMEFVRPMFRFREGMTYLSPAPLYHSAPQASVSAAIRLGGDRR